LVRSLSTSAALRRRTRGSTISKVGKAKTQEIPQEPIQILRVSGESPALRRVLIRETRKVMKADSSRGVTRVPQEAGSFRRSRGRSVETQSSLMDTPARMGSRV